APLECGGSTPLFSPSGAWHDEGEREERCRATALQRGCSVEEVQTALARSQLAVSLEAADSARRLFDAAVPVDRLADAGDGGGQVALDFFGIEAEDVPAVRFEEVVAPTIAASVLLTNVPRVAVALHVE